MGDQSFARLIKRRRDALGFSQARLGELVGRSASTIRNWERGNSTPSARSDAVALAAILGLDERDVLEGAGFEVEATGEHQTVEQAYASLAPEAPRVVEEPPEGEGDRPEPEAIETDSEQALDEVARPPAADLRPDSEVEERSPVPEARPWQLPETESEPTDERPLARPLPTPPPDESTDVPPVEEKPGAGSISTPPPDEPTDVPPVKEKPGARPTSTPPPDEPTDVPPVEETPGARPTSTPPPDELAAIPPVEEPAASRRLSRAAPPTVLEAAPPGEPSYLEDPQERQQYRLRAVGTAVLVIGLVIVLMWAFGRASEAFSSLWDDFFNQLRI